MLRCLLFLELLQKIGKKNECLTTVVALSASNVQLTSRERNSSPRYFYSDAPPESFKAVSLDNLVKIINLPITVLTSTSFTSHQHKKFNSHSVEKRAGTPYHATESDWKILLDFQHGAFSAQRSSKWAGEKLYRKCSAFFGAHLAVSL